MILAAGRSTRMGAPKALLDLGGETAGLEIEVRDPDGGLVASLIVLLGAAAYQFGPGWALIVCALASTTVFAIALAGGRGGRGFV